MKGKQRAGYSTFFLFLQKGSNISNLPVRSKMLKLDHQVNIDIRPEDMERGILNLIGYLITFHKIFKTQKKIKKLFFYLNSNI